jgi:hypothetical protein
MNTKLIQSEINRVKAEMLQLSDRTYFTEAQEETKKPLLQSQLDQLEQDLQDSINNLDVKM